MARWHKRQEQKKTRQCGSWEEKALKWEDREMRETQDPRAQLARYQGEKGGSVATGWRAIEEYQVLFQEQVVWGYAFPGSLGTENVLREQGGWRRQTSGPEMKAGQSVRPRQGWQKQGNLHWMDAASHLSGPQGPTKTQQPQKTMLLLVSYIPFTFFICMSSFLSMDSPHLRNHLLSHHL